MSSGRRRQGTSITPAPAGGHDPKRMRPGLVGAGGSEPLCTQGGGRSEVLPSGGVEKGSSAPALLRDLTVDEHLLECSVCFLAMKPPIFQCGVGHVLCSPCSEKLKDAGKCHQCGVAMPDGYQRCHAIEDMMNSIRGVTAPTIQQPTTEDEEPALGPGPQMARRSTRPRVPSTRVTGQDWVST